MEFFYVTADFNFTYPFEDGNKVTINLQKPVGKPDFKSIYAATGACHAILDQQLEHNKDKLPLDFKIKMMSKINKKQIYEHDDFPICISNFDGTISEKDFASVDPTNIKIIPDTKFIPLEKLVQPLLGQDTIKLFVVNGMGTGLGDGIVGLTALNILYNRLKKDFKNVIIDLSHTAVVGDKAHQSLYSQEKIVNSVCYLPVSVEKLMEYDLVMDNSALIIREGFNVMTMVDFYLKNMGIAPKSVPDEEKRIFIKKSDLAKKSTDITFKLLKEDPTKKLILLHTSASAQIRSMPRNLIKRAIKQILDFDPNFIVVTYDRLDDIQEEIDSYLGTKKDRYVNLNFKSQNFDIYAYIISQVDGLITVDTSSYHIGDAFDIPTLVIFQTIKPEFRIKYYPYCVGVELQKNNNKLDSVHVTLDKKHLDYIAGYWRKFDLKKHLPELKKLMTKKKIAVEDSKNQVECPICNTMNYNKPSDKYGRYNLVECTSCKAEYAVNRKMADYDEFYSCGDYRHYVQDYKDADTLLGQYMMQARFEMYMDFVRSIPVKGKYLDYACANGFLVEYAKRLGFESYGIDISEQAIAYSKKVFKFSDTTVQVSDNLDTVLLGMPELFDVISSFEIVEHLENPKSFVKSVYNRLAPGGYWIFSTPNRGRAAFANGVKNTGKHAGLESGDYPPEHLQRFRSETHKFLLQDSGFDIFHHSPTKLLSHIVQDASGPFPELNVNIGSNQSMKLPTDQIDQLIQMHVQPALSGLDAGGTFLITIARKPK